MKTSEQTDKIYPALFRLQQKLPTLKRDKVVKIQGRPDMRYTPLDSIVEQLKPIMNGEELFLSQAVNAESLVTRIMHTSGQYIESETRLNKQQSSMQAFGAEITYVRRYSLSALLGIVTDEDTDAPRISATKGVLDTLDENRKSVVVDSADYIKDQMIGSEPNEWAAYETYTGLQGDERMALWGLLPSQIRSALTKMHAAEMAKEKAIRDSSSVQKSN